MARPASLSSTSIELPPVSAKALSSANPDQKAGFGINRPQMDVFSPAGSCIELICLKINTKFNKLL